MRPAANSTVLISVVPHSFLILISVWIQWKCNIGAILAFLRASRLINTLTKIVNSVAFFTHNILAKVHSISSSSGSMKS